MEKFDQPELHPRGFPLAVNILLVGALILLPILIVALYEVWQTKHDAPVAPPTEVQTQAQPQKVPTADVQTEQSTVESSSTTEAAPAH